MDNITADEAHKPHESELREWLIAFRSDPVRAFMLVPRQMYRLLHDLNYLDGAELTPLGYKEIGG